MKPDIDKLKDIRLLASEYLDIDNLIIQIMRASGCTLQEIADAVGMTKQGIAYRLNEMGE